MKRCPKCGKAYDDTWKVCLTDRVALVNVTGKEAPEIKPAEETAKKRPVGIIVIAVLLLLAGLSGTLSLTGLIMPPPSAEINFEQFKQQALKLNPNATEKERAELNALETKPVVQDMIKAQSEFIKSGKYKVMTLSYGIYGLISLIVGIGLLMSKEWARKLAIATQLLTIALFILNISIFSSTFKTFSAHITDGKQVFPIMVAVQAIIGLIIIWVIISYLCRSQVKKWFV